MGRMAAAGVLCVFLTMTASAALPVPLEASVEPRPAIGASGALSTSSFDAVQAPNGVLDAPREIFTAAKARIVIIEERLYVSRPDRPLYAFADESRGATVSERTFQSNDTHLAITRLDAKNAWTLKPAAKANTTLTVRGACALSPVPGQTLIQSNCTAVATATGSPDLTLFGSVFHLTDANGHDEVIETGELRQDVAGRQVKVGWRWLRLETRSTDGRWEPGLGSDIRFQTPALATLGDLRIPVKSIGEIEWGDVRAQGELPSVEATGSFAFAAPNPERIHVHGQTLAGDVHVPDTMLGDVSAVAVAAVIALAAGAWLWRSRGFLWGLFSRILPHGAANHPRRRVLLQAIEQNPGASPQDLARLTGIPAGTVAHHLTILVHHGLVRRSLFGRHVALHVPGTVPEAQVAYLRTARSEASKSLLRALQDEPTASQTELGRRLGMTQQNVSRLIRRLVRAGVVAMERDENARRLYRVVAAPARTDPA